MSASRVAPGVIELVARMRREGFSRNRHFDAFAGKDAVAARARRVCRYLRSLEHDLATLRRKHAGASRLHVELRGGGARRITIEVPAVRIRRVAEVSAEEYALLREHPEAREVLDSAEHLA
jgi:hypothetical protein